MTANSDKDAAPGRRGMSGRAIARFVTFVAYAVAAVGLGLGNYTYFMWGSSHDRSGDRIGFVIWTLIAMAFVAGTWLTRWLAVVSCIMAAMGFFMFITYPVSASLTHFWGQALALVSYVVAFVSSIAIVASSDKPATQQDREQPGGVP